ncbi:MAG: transporter substrate-binding domain-containing protein [Bacteroidales bacterium]|nr:transporter substrate-binding domain-containing protein [Bacteroidales bacterium]MBN2749436.1 transporter substrate-binding domain-containing protein [Bacteroidales bacterium]
MRYIKALITLAVALILLSSISHSQPRDSREPLQKPIYIVQADSMFYPYEFANAKGEPEGFNIDIIREIARVMGLNIYIELKTWSEVIKNVESGKVDILAGLFYSNERAKYVDFTQPHSIVSYSFFVRDNEKNFSYDNLGGKEIIVQKGDISEEIVKGFSNIKVVYAPSQADALRLLSSGKHDAAVLSKLSALRYADEFRLNNIVPFGSPLETRRYCFAVSKNLPGLADRLNEGLAIIKATGEYDAIYNKWFGESASPIPRKVIWISIIAISFFIIALFTIALWNWSLSKTVQQKTQELNSELSIRKQTEKQLVKERTLLRQFINAIPDPLFHKDKDGCYVNYNNAFGALINNEEDILGKTDFDIFPSDFAKAILNSDLKAYTTKTPVIDERWITLPNGDKLLLSTHRTPFFDEKGQLIGLVGAGRNITAQHKAEEDLRVAKERAEQSDKLKSAFLANMSHEIRTPMNAIIGFSNLLLNPELLHEQKKEYVKFINSSGNTLLNLINDIIDIAKIEAGEITILEKEFNLVELLREQHALFTNMAVSQDKAHININLILPEGTSELPVVLDQLRIKQVLSNLLSNAVKFTDSGAITLGLSVSASLFEFWVTDTGIGIPQTHRKQIFEQFRQVDETLSRKYGGTGLGLTISQRLIELMNGRIWLESEEGVGSTFYFNVPITEKTRALWNSQQTNTPKPKSHKASIEANSWQHVKMLIAEDEEMNYLYLKEVLSPTGVSITWAQNGKEAVELAKSNGYNIVLMDIKMPIMNGIEAAQAILLQKPEQAIIAQTAYAMHDEKQQCLNLGFKAYLTKPLLPKILLETIQECLV